MRSEPRLDRCLNFPFFSFQEVRAPVTCETAVVYRTQVKELRSPEEMLQDGKESRVHD